MWDEPRLMNTAANALVGLAIAFALYGAGMLLVRSPAFALRSIRIDGELARVTRGAVVDALQGRVSGTFFTVDLEAVRATFQTVPWVRRADVRRRWPDRLEVTLEEHRPLGRWGDASEERLLNTQGEIFRGSYEGPLPQFLGPMDSAAELARRYAAFQAALGPLGVSPSAIVLSHRRSWQLRLSNGLTVQLGRDREGETATVRLERFVAAYPETIARLSRRLDYVDLRYPSGFALRVPEILGEQKTRRARPRT